MYFSIADSKNIMPHSMYAFPERTKGRLTEYEGKLSRTVLIREGGRNPTDLVDTASATVQKNLCCMNWCTEDNKQQSGHYRKGYLG